MWLITYEFPTQNLNSLENLFVYSSTVYWMLSKRSCWHSFWNSGLLIGFWQASGKDWAATGARKLANRKKHKATEILILHNRCTTFRGKRPLLPLLRIARVHVPTFSPLLCIMQASWHITLALLCTMFEKLRAILPSLVTCLMILPALGLIYHVGAVEPNWTFKLCFLPV